MLKALQKLRRPINRLFSSVWVMVVHNTLLHMQVLNLRESVVGLIMLRVNLLSHNLAE